MTKIVKANVFAAEDLFETVTQGYVIAAAISLRKVAQIESLALDDGEKISSLSQQIVDELLTPLFFGEGSLPRDRVNLYARELMLMGFDLVQLPGCH